MALNTITKLRLQDGREVAFVDWTDQPIYSTCEIEHGATRQEINLFQYTVGDSVPAFAAVVVTPRSATERDTNMAAPGAMASTEEMLVYSVRPEVFSMENATQGNFTTTTAPQNATGEPNPTIVQIGVLQEGLLMKLEISQKVFATGGFGYFNTGFGVWGSASTLTLDAAGRSGAINGLPSNEAVRSYVIPHHIGGQEKFRVKLQNPTGQSMGVGNAETPIQVLSGGTAGSTNAAVFVRIRVYLDGLHKRPVT